MAKSCATIIVSALCFLAFLDVALCSKDRFFIEGKVYCDTCRIQFFTRISKFLEGAKVKLVCRDEANAANKTFTGEAVTDKTGEYRIEVDGDHEEEICEVSLMESADKECSEIPTDGYGHFARISITGNDGITDPVRQANPLGFMVKNALPQCKEVLRELGFDDVGLLV
ncbi:olee1-like protein [Benincasa hispida]|uniref:olee1-like protein n=1 Tax=Benincasa hispida TaxID=102211 RepID=UPI00190289E9|nr:olee1-like protein [Benincasa hispida]